MMTNPTRIVRVIVNGISVVSALTIIGVLVSRYSQPKQRPTPGSLREWSEALGPRVGSRLTIDGVNFSNSDRTLVVAVKESCEWSNAVSAFYEELLTSPDKNYATLTITPSPLSEAQAYIDSIGLPKTALAQVDLARFHIIGTPALVLVDATGQVLDTWVGALLPRQQDTVRRALGLPVDSADTGPGKRGVL